MFNFFKAIQGYRKFSALPLSEKQVVFYAETASCFTHFKGVVEALVRRGVKICYVTSDPSDPILETEESYIEPFYIGEGAMRIMFFETLKAKVMVMTMPDLHNLEIKRSKAHPVHYVYLFHSPVSSHMIYRKGAFDHYDSVLCVGPHHMKEMRAMEELYGTKPKQLFAHGYERIDALLELKTKEKPKLPTNRDTTVLIAPSWGPHGIIETIGDQLVDTLLEGGYRVVLRPHPMTKKKNPSVLRNIQQKHHQDPQFSYDQDVAMSQSLVESDLMISDYSGVAFEYALGLEKPVIFIDVPRKVRNDEYEQVACVPAEVSLRSKMGSIIGTDEIDLLPEKIEQLFHTDIKKSLADEREKQIYHPGNNGEKGASAILSLL